MADAVVQDRQRRQRDDEMPAYTPRTASTTRLTAFGTCLPGSLDSSAMFATVSMPVYASIASDSAKISSSSVGTDPR